MEATPTFAGIDWSWQHHALCIVDDDGQRIEEVTLPHSKPGLGKITTLLRRHGVAQVGIERGDGPVVEHLIRDGFEVVVISARQVKSLRARYGSAGNKDDRFDAFVLADALRTDTARWAVVQPDTEETIALRMLVRSRHDLIDHRIAVHNQLLAVLQHNFPGAIGLFSQLDIGISLAFLRRFPTEAKAAWLSQLRMAHWLKANGYCGRQSAADLVDHLRNAATGRVSGPAAEASELVVLTLVDLLSKLREQQSILETRIKEALLAHPDGPIFQSLPRAGTVRAATLLAEIGDCRARFPDAAALAAAAGVAPSTRQSGKHLNVAYRRGCNKTLRAALIDWAQDTPRANAWARDTYDRARQRGCRHPHAARILAQAWTRILWRCWHDQVPYNPDLHGRLSLITKEAA
ncbi:IS110 family transposase [Nocardioides sp. cx-173]|uniref:IS110 family transposase n=1 Tax=Nocardioides sp. cx-173 TaxID=2898796 RepID=UPI001E4F0168|nr:IS110 family transposase [Nocardioides sp. cx-173]MCD4527496.1 IS110 family transposase [Nocardioides sp. cx-173]UGB42389.1 IS110 family transposase [Nocardioides sp. cx-173]UGB42424.1 IS110 family transposase [Nocardioides sp. cx-173]UGB43465.1 IS110 family transposase [Nocardioides sp. cx-173]